VKSGKEVGGYGGIGVSDVWDIVGVVDGSGDVDVLGHGFCVGGEILGRV
jgi:hypothetical protein